MWEILSGAIFTEEKYKKIKSIIDTTYCFYELMAEDSIFFWNATFDKIWKGSVLVLRLSR